jgi:hypothetical protein
MNITSSEAVAALDQTLPMKEAHPATKSTNSAEEISSKHEISSTKKKSGGWWGSKKAPAKATNVDSESKDLETSETNMKQETSNTDDVGQSKVGALLPVARLFRRGTSDTSKHKPVKSIKGGWFSRKKSQTSTQANSEDVEVKVSNVGDNSKEEEDAAVVQEDNYDEQFMELFDMPEAIVNDRLINEITLENVAADTTNDDVYENANEATNNEVIGSANIVATYTEESVDSGKEDDTTDVDVNAAIFTDKIEVLEVGPLAYISDNVHGTGKPESIQALTTEDGDLDASASSEEADTLETTETLYGTSMRHNFIRRVCQQKR